MHIISSSVSRWTSEMLTQVVVPTSRFCGRDYPLAHNPAVHLVEYSDHSMYEELVEFVTLVRPCSLYPIVAGEDELANVSSFKTYCSPKKPVRFWVWLRG